MEIPMVDWFLNFTPFSLFLKTEAGATSAT